MLSLLVVTYCHFYQHYVHENCGYHWCTAVSSSTEIVLVTQGDRYVAGTTQPLDDKTVQVQQSCQRLSNSKTVRPIQQLTYKSNCVLFDYSIDKLSGMEVDWCPKSKFRYVHKKAGVGKCTKSLSNSNHIASESKKANRCGAGQRRKTRCNGTFLGDLATSARKSSARVRVHLYQMPRNDPTHIVVIGQINAVYCQDYTG